jgi:hypothetical protein
MTNEELAVRLMGTIVQPSVAVPARRESIELHDAQVQHAAEFAVHVYRLVLDVLQSQPAAETSPAPGS